ncbi:MAG: outer membrane protein assembly factor BamA [Elusimicrobia bacterium]|nr:outer membrane protein assembly factor BamA [Elusimicrobiota bacterium]
MLILSALCSSARAQEPPPEASPTISSETAPSPTPVVPVVAQIQFYGLKTVSEDRAKALVAVRLWEPYTPELQARDLATLLGSGLFLAVTIKEVPLSAGAIRVDYDVKEGVPETPKPLLAPDTSSAPAPPWVLGELEISGQKHVKRATIRTQVKGRKGDLYDRPDLDRDIQAVLGLGGFERVAADVTPLPERPVPAHFSGASPSPWQVKLTFLVEEKPLVRKIDFNGRVKMGKGTLLEAMSLKKGDPFDRAKLRDDGEKLLETYRKKGYLRASVEPSVAIDTTALQADVAMAITEGPRSKLMAVVFKGNTALKPKKILKTMVNKPGWLFDKPLSEKDLPEDMKKVEAAFKNQGYLDFKINETSVTFNAEATEATITVDLDQGPQYRYGDTTFSGYTLYAATDLAKALDYRKGKLFSQERFDATIRSLQELFAEKGRLRALITPERSFNAVTGLMDVKFLVEEGPPVYIDHVDVEGYKTTKPWVFKREILLKPGNLFQVSKLRKSQEKIMNLGFIDDVQPDVQSPYDPEKVDLSFEILEGKPGMLTAGAGFSSLDGLLGTLSLQHLNLFGRAWRSSVQWSFGARVNDFQVSWLTPWVKDKPISLGLDAYNTRRVSPFAGSSSAYTNKRVGGAVRVGPRFADDMYRLDTYYSFTQISLTGIDTQFLGQLSEGTSVQSMIGATFARDTRDNIWDPARGGRHALSLDLAGGPVYGDINFLRPALANAQHFTLAQVNEYPLVLTLSNRLGYVTQFGNTRQVPVFERFFIGGQDTLRGYSAAGEAGYRDGGRIHDVFNIELGFPLARERRKTIVKFVTFFDAGASWDSPRTVQLKVGQDQQHIKTDVGFGIRFVTPAFPIRLDWGYGFQHRPGEAKYQINFGIGNLF